MSPLRAALEAAFPEARVIDDGSELYASADLAQDQMVSLHATPEGVVACRYEVAFVGLAEGRTAEEALAELLSERGAA